MEFNKEQHTGPEKDSLWEDENEKKKANVPIKDCKMDYRMKQKSDPSGENNLTEGMSRNERTESTKDGNSQPKMKFIWNHPRIVQAPHASAYYGANNDTQIIIIAKNVIDIVGRENFEQFTNNLVAAGWAGLDHSHSLFLVVKCISSYQCKGNKGSKQWNTTSQVTQASNTRS